MPPANRAAIALALLVAAPLALPGPAAQAAAVAGTVEAPPLAPKAVVPAAAADGIDRTAKGDSRHAQNLFGRLLGGGGAGGGGEAKKRALLRAYPGAFTIEGNAVAFPSGQRIVWDDGRNKSPAELLTDADVEDMFAYPYPLAAAGEGAPPRLSDPGRVRSEAFFRALYGGSEAEVARTTTRIPWVPAIGTGAVTVTTRFGIAERLKAVSADLQRLPARFHPYLTPSAGGFVFRPIAGTDRLSVHSFGAAVDINTRYTNYWRWDGQPEGGTIPYRNQIPMEIVAVFEKHCFIWGGRWYHYDTMHFEYRPELIPDCHR